MDELNLAMFTDYNVLSVERVVTETWKQSKDGTELLKAYTDIVLSVVFVSDEPLYILVEQPFMSFGYSVVNQSTPYRDVGGRRRVDVNLRMVASH